jgi:hypothetical protein
MSTLRSIILLPLPVKKAKIIAYGSADFVSTLDALQTATKAYDAFLRR